MLLPSCTVLGRCSRLWRRRPFEDEALEERLEVDEDEEDDDEEDDEDDEEPLPMSDGGEDLGDVLGGSGVMSHFSARSMGTFWISPSSY